jgi:hypothetical protein
MRILVANSPRMYRESLALALQRHSPDFEVLIVPPEIVDGQAERFRPQVFVRDDDGVETRAPNGVILWVGIKIDDHLHARIIVDGEISELHDVSLEELFAVLDELERRLSSGSGGD